MAATLYLWQYIHSRVSMVVADGLVHILCQNICSHRDDVSHPAYTKWTQRNVYKTVKIETCPFKLNVLMVTNFP